VAGNIRQALPVGRVIEARVARKHGAKEPHGQHADLAGIAANLRRLLLLRGGILLGEFGDLHRLILLLLLVIILLVVAARVESKSKTLKQFFTCTFQSAKMKVLSRCVSSSQPAPPYLVGGIGIELVVIVSGGHFAPVCGSQRCCRLAFADLTRRLQQHQTAGSL